METIYPVSSSVSLYAVWKASSPFNLSLPQGKPHLPVILCFTNKSFPFLKIAHPAFVFLWVKHPLQDKLMWIYDVRKPSFLSFVFVNKPACVFFVKQKKDNINKDDRMK